MLYLYFIYGLSFFTLGIAILFYPRKDSEFPIAQTLLFVGLFGICHGVHEWAEMFSLLPQYDGSAFPQVVALACLPASFLCLILFGIESLAIWPDRPLLRRLFPAVLFVVWIIITAVGPHHFLAANVWARYLLGIPGAGLAALALRHQVPQLSRVRTSLAINLNVAAATFACYGIFSGLVGPEAGFFPASAVNNVSFIRLFGIPVQVFRAVCAAVITISLISMLRLFTWETQGKLRNLSLRDELTGLLNRRGFFALVEQRLKIAKRQRRHSLLLVGDVDDLKAINDTRGHAAGDAALVEIAAILRDSFREADVIARIGGDEFAVLQVDNIDSDARATVARLQGNLAARNTARPADSALAMSVGAVSCEPDGACTFDQLIARADDEMYGHKKSRTRIRPPA